MSIPSTFKAIRSGIVGTLANDGPRRVAKVVLKYTFSSVTENFATPSRAVTFDPTDGTVAPGGAGVFAGLILGNERVASPNGESWYATGETIEVIQFGEVFVNIDDFSGNPSSAAAVGGSVYYQNTTGKLAAASGGGYTKIAGAVITAVDGNASGTRLARVVLNGPQA